MTLVDLTGSKHHPDLLLFLRFLTENKGNVMNDIPGTNILVPVGLTCVGGKSQVSFILPQFP